MGSKAGSKNWIELRVSADDVEALRRARERRVTPEEFARLLAQVRARTEDLRRRAPTRGERFRL